MLSQRAEASTLKRAAVVAAVRLNVLMNQRQKILETDGMRATYDHENAIRAQAVLSIAIGILQDVFVD
jgi:hypothetical protein